MTKDVYSIRLSEDHRRMLFKLKEHYKEKENLELTSTDIIIAGITNLYNQKIMSNKKDTI